MPRSPAGPCSVSSTNINSENSFQWKLLSRVLLFMTPWTIQSIEFSRPEYWSREPFPSPGDLPNPGMEQKSPSLQEDYLPAKPQRELTTFWILAKSLHLRSMLSKSMRCTEIFNNYSQHWVNRKGPILHDNTWQHITQSTLQKLNELDYKVLPHPP